MDSFLKDSAVNHVSLGRGRVIVDQGETVIVRFDSGIHDCLRAELRAVADVGTSTAAVPAPPARVLSRILAVAIRSVNDSWGVFSNSRVDLLPHQLWVCRHVLEHWPARWLVADDVGLGKTIEAGLILTPLVSSGRVRRLLVLAPASLVEQWQQRMREMFEVRLTRYTAEADTPKADFWGTTMFVVASAQTLRANKNDRWRRLLEAEPWDLVLVDEAHHVNDDEKSGATLAYQLITQMEERGRIRSMIFFSGTPHRGKDYGFLALLKLLRPDRFDPKRPVKEQLSLLRDVMIRNNKSVVTDMAGKVLFQPVKVDTELYAYSPTEEHFYRLLTEFIQTGRAYASELAAAEQRTAILVLIAMQKLASSSVAAIRRALVGRVARLREAERKRGVKESDGADVRKQLQKLREDDDPADADLRAALEERLAALGTDALVGLDEIPAIEELISAADAVTEETKVNRIIELVERRFADRSVLFFTEYKATQSLVMSALRARFGEDCVTFINGDGRADGVRSADGAETSLVVAREDAAGRFRRGEVRFLVSTEAAGEGIDLQESCHCLIHVDLPWNPMRLHQRVGRLNRYGQRYSVEVVSLRNPDTVEGRIWECLNEKLARITQAFNSAMEDPEDMLQLVLGMSSTGELERIFSEARGVPREKMREWFDAQASTFGGRKAIDAVRELVGNVARFDFGAAKADLPQVDLPDLLPFFKMTLALNRKRCEEVEECLSFKTPEAWCESDFAVRDRYEGLRFRRDSPGSANVGHVCGVGHRVFDVALRSAEGLEDVFAIVPGLPEVVAVFAVRDQVTTGSGLVRRAVFGVAGVAPDWRLIADWELIRSINIVAQKPQTLVRLSGERAGALARSPQEHVAVAREWFEGVVRQQALPFNKPLIDPIALLVPEVNSSGTGSTQREV